MLRFLTAGESHGPSEVAILEGMPSGLEITKEEIQIDLNKRRGGAGRGGRGLIEKDQVEILSGVRHGKTLGSPIALFVKNSDFANWAEKMQSAPLSGNQNVQEITNPRPGHTDLPGSLKYGFTDIRNVLERASARETITRVAVGAVLRKFLSKFYLTVESKILQIGGIKIENNSQIEAIIMSARLKKDTLGGIIEVVAKNVPPGLGSYVHWDRKIDASIAQALMSIPSVKAVEIGTGFENASKFGSQIQDEIFYQGKYLRKTNRAGGIEGGVTNGENIVCRVFHKPISTLGNPLSTVDLKSKQNTKALIERSDICVVPRAGIISESMLMYILAKEFLQKFGSDNIDDIGKSFKNYLLRIDK